MTEFTTEDQARLMQLDRDMAAIVRQQPTSAEDWARFRALRADAMILRQKQLAMLAEIAGE